MLTKLILLFILGGGVTTFVLLLSYLFFDFKNTKVFVLENYSISQDLKKIQKMILIIPTSKWSD